MHENTNEWEWSCERDSLNSLFHSKQVGKKHSSDILRKGSLISEVLCSIIDSSHSFPSIRIFMHIKQKSDQTTCLCISISDLCNSYRLTLLRQYVHCEHNTFPKRLYIFPFLHVMINKCGYHMPRIFLHAKRER